MASSRSLSWIRTLVRDLKQRYSIKRDSRQRQFDAGGFRFFGPLLTRSGHTEYSAIGPAITENGFVTEARRPL